MSKFWNRNCSAFLDFIVLLNMSKMKSIAKAQIQNWLALCMLKQAIVFNFIFII